MCDEFESLAVSDMFYPEWWNVNTHRSNHVNRTPLFQANYGMGRALFGDWGRVGAVKARSDSDGVKVIPQISPGLAGKLHRGHVPVPLLTPFYTSSVLLNRHRVFSANSCDSPLSDPNILPNGLEDTSLAGGEFASYDLLSDPIAGDHAAAALLCEKLYYRLRRNRTAFGSSTTQSISCPSSPTSTSALSKWLDKLENLAFSGLQCSSSAEQDLILRQIDQLINFKSLNTNSDQDSDEWDSAVPGDLCPTPERRSGLPKRRRIVRKKGRKQQRLPPFLKSTVQFNTTNPVSGFEYSPWLAGLDPFLIRLAVRPTNHLFQGQGLLCQIRHSLLSTTTHSDSPVLLWSPPKSWDCEPDSPNPIFFSSWSPPLLPQDNLEFCSHLTTKLFSEAARICELNAVYANNTSRVNILSRWAGGSGTNNVLLFNLDIDKSRSSPSPPPLLSPISQPTLPSQASTLCFNPFLADEWALAGNHIAVSSGDRFAFIRLYPIDSPNPVWSGHVALDDPRESVLGMDKACCVASGLANSSDMAQNSLTDFTGYIHPRFSVFTNGLRCAPFDQFIRLAYGSDPSQLCLTTSQRMILIDTRQHSVAQPLFRFCTGNPARDSLFHVTDRLTCAAPRFLGDVYVIAGTAYNMLVLDKRMPTRPVLHWSHSLFGEPTYLDWTLPSRFSREKYDLPEVFVTICAQNPPSVSCFGLNLASSSGPQLVGPECAGATLSKMLTETRDDLPTRLTINKAVTRRLQSTYCGINTNMTSIPGTDRDCLASVVLTSAGDLFMHNWYFNPSDESADHDAQSQRCHLWLSELRCHLTADARTDPSVRSGQEKSFEVDLTEINRIEPPGPVPTESDANCQYWEFSYLPPTEDFSDQSDVIRVSRQLVCDLRAYWNEDHATLGRLTEKSCLREARTAEERLRRRDEVDSCAEAAKSRIRRFQHILNQMTKDEDIGSYANDSNDEEVETSCSESF
ncbi:hypothetical protein FBUS_01017 [Fasciolopsis buskii]|uniref:Uncharacterized protein n=1 Tax=Fasciolopsis buskii TaxID=27845 RepID=A0A8E0S315_9TREM|nr:hypothetical protein FBUS_01017 [Fasciolopsis buski]